MVFITLFQLGLALFELKNYKQALIMFEKAIHFEPKNANYYDNKGIKIF